MTYGHFRWQNNFFAHWQLADKLYEPLLPTKLTLDTWNGSSYLSLVGLHAIGPAPKRVVQSRIGARMGYHQVNLRTYVTGPRGPGIFLLETRVDRVVGMGGRALGMPYHIDRRLELEVDEELLWLRGESFALQGHVTGALPALAQPGTLDHFLLERYWVYSVVGDRLIGVRVEHPAWMTTPVRLSTRLSPETFGLGGDEDTVSAHYAEQVDVAITAIDTLGRVIRLRAEAEAQDCLPFVPSKGV